MSTRVSRWLVILDREPRHGEVVSLREEIEGLGFTGREVSARIYLSPSTARLQAVHACACSHVRRLHEDEAGACTLCGCTKYDDSL